jgi:hypothetical protein
MFHEMISRKKASFDRRLGASSDQLLVDLEKALAAKGRFVGGKKGSGATKLAVMRALKVLARAHAEQIENKVSSKIAEDGGTTRRSEAKRDESKGWEEDKENEVVLGTGANRDATSFQGDCAQALQGEPTMLPFLDVWTCVVDLYRHDGESVERQPCVSTSDGEERHSGVEEGSSEKVAVAEKSASGSNGADAKCDDKVVDEDDEEDEEVGDEDELLPVPSKKSGSKKDWDWKSDLFAIIKNIAGLRKLCAERPSTAPIGNWGILQGVSRLSDAAGLGSFVRAKLFMGKKRLGTAAKKTGGGMEFPLSRQDDTKTQQKQWEGLRGAVTRPGEALLFHLKNHYALVFAAREWVTPEGEEMKQILCARKGQRPTAWISFSEARETMLGWEGYKMMLLSRSADTTANHLCAVKERISQEFDRPLDPFHRPPTDLNTSSDLKEKLLFPPHCL